MDSDEELRKLRRDVEELRKELRNRRPDNLLVPAGTRVMFVTEDISAMSGSTTGSGQAVDAVYDPATGNLTAGTGPPQEVRNYHEKKFLVGGIIEIFPWSGAWWPDDVDRCDKYS